MVGFEITTLIESGWLGHRLDHFEIDQTEALDWHGKHKTPNGLWLFHAQLRNVARGMSERGGPPNPTDLQLAKQTELIVLFSIENKSSDI